MKPDSVIGKTYKERAQFQLEQWVDGNPLHNETDNECCPDFSCCKPHLLAEKETRKIFARSSDQERAPMISEFVDRNLEEAFGQEKGFRNLYNFGHPLPN